MSETAPTTMNRTLMRLPNTAYRPREYLTEAEVAKPIEAARRRDGMAYATALRSC
jgi:hypothetical protein